MERLRRRFPHTLALSFEPVGAPRAEASYAERVRGLDDLDLCCSFLTHVRGRDAGDDERAVLAAALEQGRLVDHLPARSAAVAAERGRGAA
jgi:exonuclease SbcD